MPVARLDVYHPHSCKGAASYGASVIRAGRVAGKSFCKIGRELSVARNSVVDRAVELGVCAPEARTTAAAARCASCRTGKTARTPSSSRLGTSACRIG